MLVLWVFTPCSTIGLSTPAKIPPTPFPTKFRRNVLPTLCIRSSVQYFKPEKYHLNFCIIHTFSSPFPVQHSRETNLFTLRIEAIIKEQQLREASINMKACELLFTQVIKSISWLENDTALISRKHSRPVERDPRPSSVERTCLSSYLRVIAPIITWGSGGSWVKYMLELGTEFYGSKYCYFAYISS
jgi:hypothetical protein